MRKTIIATGIAVCSLLALSAFALKLKAKAPEHHTSVKEKKSKRTSTVELSWFISPACSYQLEFWGSQVSYPIVVVTPPGHSFGTVELPDDIYTVKAYGDLEGRLIVGNVSGPYIAQGINPVLYNVPINSSNSINTILYVHLPE